jgi:hypothetical protein
MPFVEVVVQRTLIATFGCFFKTEISKQLVRFLFYPFLSPELIKMAQFSEENISG